MRSPGRLPHIHRTSTRLIVMLAAGVLTAAGTAALGGWLLAPIIGWATASVVYVVWVWSTVGHMDAGTTASHATREDPSRAVSDLLVLFASLGSLGAVLYLLVQEHSTPLEVRGSLAGVAVVSVALSWGLIHTLFTLRYASLYYWDQEGGIDFNQDEPPRYSDFAYLAFTLGMTFQVSDTNLQSNDIRATALRHGLLSYVFGSVILATLINLIVGLSR
jgi:uncharacterized membrane protein